MQLENKTAVITGAGSGLGKALSESLLARGMNLALVDVRPERITELANSFKNTSRKISVHTADVSDRKRMQALLGEVLAEHENVQLLVNNAGVTSWGYFQDVDLDDFDWVMDVNFRGIVHGCKVFLPHLQQQSQARIVNLSSMFGWTGVPSQTAYCASKHAVRGFSESFAAELEGSNVGITIVHPGGIQSNLAADSRAASDEFKTRFAGMMERTRSADKVAELIIKAVEKDKFRVLTGPESYVTEWLKRLMPVRGQKLLANYLKKSMGLGPA